MGIYDLVFINLKLYLLGILKNVVILGIIKVIKYMLKSICLCFVKIKYMVIIEDLDVLFDRNINKI